METSKLPISNELERVIIGMLINGNVSFEEISSFGINRKSFFTDVNREIFEKIKDFSEQKQPYDLAGLGIAMPDHMRAIVEISTSTPHTENVDYYARELSDLGWQRETIIELSNYIHRLAIRRPGESINQFKNIGEDMMRRVFDDKATNDNSRSLPADTLSAMVSQIIEKRVIAHRAGSASHISTGFRLLDDTIGGFSPGSLYILAARTSMGKTTLAVNFSLNAMKINKGVLFFTVEMSEVQIHEKKIPILSEIYNSSLVSGNLNDGQLDRIYSTLGKLSKMPIHINSRFKRSFQNLEFESRRLVKAGKVHFIIVDYLQQLHIDGARFTTKQAEITEITARLKALAMDLEVPILALAQVNREADKQTNVAENGPSMHHLKDSGSIEQDADVVMFLHREAYYGNADTNWIIVSKNRHGNVGKLQIDANLSINKFY